MNNNKYIAVDENMNDDLIGGIDNYCCEDSCDCSCDDTYDYKFHCDLNHKDKQDCHNDKHDKCDKDCDQALFYLCCALKNAFKECCKQGPRGPRGPRGCKGEKGEQGEIGPTPGWDFGTLPMQKVLEQLAADPCNKVSIAAEGECVVECAKIVEVGEAVVKLCKCGKYIYVPICNIIAVCSPALKCVTLEDDTTTPEDCKCCEPAVRDILEEFKCNGKATICTALGTFKCAKVTNVGKGIVILNCRVALSIPKISSIKRCDC